MGPSITNRTGTHNSDGMHGEDQCKIPDALMPKEGGQITSPKLPDPKDRKNGDDKIESRGWKIMRSQC